MNGHNYALSSASTADVKTEDTSGDLQPSEIKPKKGKKFIKCCIPIQDNKNNEVLPKTKVEPARKGKKRPASPELGPTIDISKIEEDTLVEKITGVLLKHKFQNIKGFSIGNLVTKVKNLVAKGYIDSEDSADELTISIANILLPMRVSVLAATDIMCESINNSAAPCHSTAPEPPPAPVRQKPGPASKKKGVIPKEEKPETSQTMPNEASNDPGTKTKRRAAIQAEKHIDSIVQDVVIDLDEDDYDPGDKDFVPEELSQNAHTKSQRKTDGHDTGTSDTVQCPSNLTIKKRKVSTPSVKIKLTSDNNVEILTKPVTDKDKQIQSEPTVKKSTPPLDASDSILLSDDEEPMTSKEPPKTSKKPTKTSNVPPKKVAETPVDKDIVPLPKALLKNQNFIDIVAYTYLSGNPRLDVDAAKLAAQYSTLKAYDEVQRTGKDVCSGPIYDIAVKVSYVKLSRFNK